MGTSASEIDTLVFLPGFLCDERLWKYQVQSFASSYETHVIDFKHCTNLDEMVAAIAAVSAPKFHLVGFSMGGYIAECFVKLHADRLNSLVLVAASIAKLSDEMKQGRLRLASVLKTLIYRGMTEKELTHYIHPDSLTQNDVTETILGMSASYTSKIYMNEMMATLEREDLSSTISALNVPVTIIAGADDQVIPISTLQALHAKATRSQFHTVKCCGHYVPLEQPDELTRLISAHLRSV